MTTPNALKVLARLDGTLVPTSLPLLRGDDLGVLRGDGVFETVLVVGDAPRDLREHLVRLAQSAESLDLSIPSPDEWQPAIRAVLAAWGGDSEMVLRLVATRGPEDDGGPTCYAIGSALPQEVLAARDGVGVLVLPRGFTSADIAGKPYLLPGASSLSYAVNMAAGRWAKAHDADDVIFVGTDGAVLEGPTSSVVVARDGELVTPSPDGILAGITARRLLKAAADHGWSTSVATLYTDDLHAADGVFLVSSTTVLAPVVSIDSEPCARDDALAASLAGLLEVPGR